ncbi:alpha/beta hydrolase [Rhizobium sp. PP-F2F-G48]|uniref:alpha/beta fold hydrolase n=1 Tax=Rhizobium sp. PP-F2F-G48 TaxID=2135651 RepID=UPI001FE1DE6B|nr:alpha/beta hydrolase [Rhizobium sp. PP-F2F-G48]
MMFAHGYGCDQGMWRYVAPQFSEEFRILTFDHVGSGGSDSNAFDPGKYATLKGYAEDVIEIAREATVQGGIFVGHSVSAMIGVLAAIEAPELFDELVLVCPSPYFLNDGDYLGGFTQGDIDELLASMSNNYAAWSNTMAPAIIGNADRPELGQELASAFCRMDPAIAGTFARATFTSDNRPDLPKVSARTLVLQCRDDILAGEHIGAYVASQVPDASLVILDATGHCPNLSAPHAVNEAIKAFVGSP